MAALPVFLPLAAAAFFTVLKVRACRLRADESALGKGDAGGEREEEEEEEEEGEEGEEKEERGKETLGGGKVEGEEGGDPAPAETMLTVLGRRERTDREEGREREGAVGMLATFEGGPVLAAADLLACLPNPDRTPEGAPEDPAGHGTDDAGDRIAGGGVAGHDGEMFFWFFLSFFRFP